MKSLIRDFSLSLFLHATHSHLIRSFSVTIVVACTLLRHGPRVLSEFTTNTQNCNTLSLFEKVRIHLVFAHVWNSETDRQKSRKRNSPSCHFLSHIYEMGTCSIAFLDRQCEHDADEEKKSKLEQKQWKVNENENRTNDKHLVQSFRKF